MRVENTVHGDTEQKIEYLSLAGDYGHPPVASVFFWETSDVHHSLTKPSGKISFDNQSQRPSHLYQGLYL